MKAVEKLFPTIMQNTPEDFASHFLHITDVT